MDKETWEELVTAEVPHKMIFADKVFDRSVEYIREFMEVRPDLQENVILFYKAVINSLADDMIDISDLKVRQHNCRECKNLCDINETKTKNGKVRGTGTCFNHPTAKAKSIGIKVTYSTTACKHFEALEGDIYGHS